MDNVVVPINTDEVGRSLLNELNCLSEEDWKMIEAMKNEPTRMFRMQCTMLFAMNDEDTEDSCTERIVSELEKLHPNWLEYETKIRNITRQ